MGHLTFYTKEAQGTVERSGMVEYNLDGIEIPNVYIRANRHDVESIFPSLKIRLNSISVRNHDIASAYIEIDEKVMKADFADRKDRLVLSLFARINFDHRLGSGYSTSYDVTPDLGYLIGADEAAGNTGANLRKPGPPPEGREPAEGLNDEERRAQIIAKVAELSGQPLAQLWASLVAPASGTESKPIPTEPPGGQLYVNRPDRSQSAPEFIAAVYKNFLHGDFTRADLRRIDPKAEMALRNWERDHRTRAAINLPTIKERNDALIAAGLIVTDDPAETARRAIAAANRAKRNTKI